MGVTPDLLKHYEELGMIVPRRSDSGYRYYPFQTAMYLIECIRLRNYGMTLREIREILTEHGVKDDQVNRRLSENMGHLRQEILLDEALTEDYEEFLKWKEALANRDWDWEIRRSRPMCFLPHTDRDDFLQDPRIYEILKDWMSYIPIVKSCMKVEEKGQITWGFVVRESDLQKLQLPLNGVVEQIPSRKVFYYKFRAPLVTMREETGADFSHPAEELLRSLNLKSTGAYYRATLMPADWEQDINRQYGYYAYTLKEE